MTVPPEPAGEPGCWLAVCRPGGASLADLAAAEHLAVTLAEVLGGATWVASHVVAEPEPHYAVSLRVGVDPVDARLAAAEQAGPSGGWAVLGRSGAGEFVTDGPPYADHGVHAVTAALDLAHRRSGRLVRFPGQADLPAELPLSQLHDRCVIEEVEVLGVPLPGDLRVRTRGFVRPVLTEGRIRLSLVPWADGVVVPFEQEDQHPSCGGH